MKLLPLCLLLAVPAVRAQVRASNDYTLSPEGLSPGLQQSVSTDYTMQATLDSAPATGTSRDYTLKHGHIAQLTDITGLTAIATPATVPETGERQLAALHTLDDGTSTAASSVLWSLVAGPVARISRSGLATAGPVYQNTPATVRATAGLLTADLVLVIEDILPDNFGTYAADGLPDWWQFQYFGLDNAAAGPLLDPDNDGQTNLLEYQADVNPADAASLFEVFFDPAPDAPGEESLRFRPVSSRREYPVLYSLDLTPDSWNRLPNATVTDTGNERRVTDHDAGGRRKFYQVVPGP